MNRAISILLIEDNPADVYLMQEVLGDTDMPIELHIAKDGEEAIDFLYARNQFANIEKLPDLVILDLNLPKRHGCDILEEIKMHKEFRKIPVLVLSSSKAPEDVSRCYQLYANTYMRKPVDLDSFQKLIQIVRSYWLEFAELIPVSRQG